MKIDVRTLVDNDEGLQDGILQALEQYNTEQHITVTPPGLDYDVKSIPLVTCRESERENENSYSVKLRLLYPSTVKLNKTDTSTLAPSKHSNLIICV